MRVEEAKSLINKFFEDCLNLFERAAGEYSHSEDVFKNFKRSAEAAGISKEAALLVFLNKHIDGISSWIRGNRNQRDSIEGRIMDAVVYLAILYCMVKDEGSSSSLLFNAELCFNAKRDKC